MERSFCCFSAPHLLVCLIPAQRCLRGTGLPSSHPSSLLPPPSPRRETAPSRRDAVGPADHAQPASRPRTPSSAAGRALGPGGPGAAARVLDSERLGC